MNITKFLAKWDTRKVDGRITLREVPKGKARELAADYNSLRPVLQPFVKDYVLSEPVRKLLGIPTPPI